MTGIVIPFPLGSLENLCHVAALFLSLGMFVFILGIECLIVDRATLNRAEANGLGAQIDQLDPPEWAPWSLLSAGAVVMLYSFTLPQKLKGAK